MSYERQTSPEDSPISWPEEVDSPTDLNTTYLLPHNPLQERDERLYGVYLEVFLDGNLKCAGFNLPNVKGMSEDELKQKWPGGVFVSQEDSRLYAFPVGPAAKEYSLNPGETTLHLIPMESFAKLEKMPPGESFFSPDMAKLADLLRHPLLEPIGMNLLDEIPSAEDMEDMNHFARDELLSETRAMTAGHPALVKARSRPAPRKKKSYAKCGVQHGGAEEAEEEAEEEAASSPPFSTKRIRTQPGFFVRK